MKLKFRQQHSQKELRQQKVAELTQELSSAKSIILFSSQNVTHKAFEEFRIKLAPFQAKLRFVKNTLFKVAAKSLDYPKELYSQELLTGPSSAIYILTDDYISVIKVLHEQFGSQENVIVKIALLDKEIYQSAQVMEFAKIPSVEQLRAMLVRNLNSPVQKLHYALTYDLGKLVRSLSAIIQKGMNN